MDEEAGEATPQKVNIVKPRLTSCGSITKDDMSKCIVDLCEVSSLTVKANSALCVQCGKWIHGRCAGMKRVTPQFSRNLTCRKYEGNIGEIVEQEVKLCDEV